MLIGRNGAGKTTMLKALLSDAPGMPAVTGGYRRRQDDVGPRSVDRLFPAGLRLAMIQKGMTAVEWLHPFDPQASRQEIRGLLGQMLFSGEEP